MTAGGPMAQERRRAEVTAQDLRLLNQNVEAARRRLFVDKPGWPVEGCLQARKGKTSSRPFRVRAGLSESPLQVPDPAPELVLRNHEGHEIRRAPLQQLTA